MELLELEPPVKPAAPQQPPAKQPAAKHSPTPTPAVREQSRTASPEPRMRSTVIAEAPAQGAGLETRETWEAMNRDVLRKVCKERGLKVKGTKAQMVNRLLGLPDDAPGGAESPSRRRSASPSVTPAFDTVFTRMDLEPQTCDQLKELCRARGLPVSGKKEMLIKRLLGGATAASHARSASPVLRAASAGDIPSTLEGVQALTKTAIQDQLRARGLSPAGLKPQLVDRLWEAYQATSGGADAATPAPAASTPAPSCPPATPAVPVAAPTRAQSPARSLSPPRRDGTVRMVPRKTPRTAPRPSSPSTGIDLANLTVFQLGMLCENAGLPKSGLKTDLVKRLTKAGSGAAGGQAAAAAHSYSRVAGYSALIAPRTLAAYVAPENELPALAETAAGAAPGRRLSAADRQLQLAEAFAGRVGDIAKGYAKCGKAGPLLVAAAGTLVRSRTALLDCVPDMSGNYIISITPPDEDGTQGEALDVPVYLGKAGGDSNATLKKRIEAYINTDGTFGPRSEPKKLVVFLDLLSRGFGIHIRFRTGKTEARRAEAVLLKKIDFPLNTQNNGGQRPIKLPSGKAVTDYPVKYPELAQVVAAMQQLLEWQSKSKGGVSMVTA